jgi:multicomponent Na+:H+ antiporter subunit D
LLLPITTLATLTVLIGLAAGPLFALSIQTAEQLLNPREYIQAVLRGRP